MDDCVICGQRLDDHQNHAGMCLFILHDAFNKINQSQKVLAKLGIDIKLVPKTVT